MELILVALLTQRPQLVSDRLPQPSPARRRLRGGRRLGRWPTCALRLAPLVRGHGPARLIARACTTRSPRALRLDRDRAPSERGLDLGDRGPDRCAAMISVLAVRSLLRPAPGANHHVEHEYRAARAIVERHGEDSLSPFILRPDKALHFAAGGVLSYRVIRGTAIVSSDPVAPGGAAPRGAGRVPGRWRPRAAGRWRCGGRPSGTSTAYRELGLRAICVGEEAFVDPRAFTLDGPAGAQAAPVGAPRGAPRLGDHGPRGARDRRRARGRDRRSWSGAWRAASARLHGFAMGMGRVRVRGRGPTTSTCWPALRDGRARAR